MKNLKGNDFLNMLKDNIHYSISRHKNICVTINFVFIYQVGKEVREIKKTIGYSFGSFNFKDVYFDFRKFSKDLVIDIIVSNFCNLDNFSYIACVEKIGDETCHGHNEYYGEDNFTFIYRRIK